MSARDELREVAKLFDWTVVDQRDYDIYTRGDKTIHVLYRRGDSVGRATLYRFFKIDDLQELETVQGRHRKARILHWLAA